MSESLTINNVSGSGLLRIFPARPALLEGPLTDTALSDHVEFSDVARFLSELESPVRVRTARVAGVRAAIERGEYETAEKLDKAIEALLREIE